MSTEIKSNGEFKVSIGDENAPSLTFNGAGDLIIRNPARTTEGRALVPWNDDVLCVNFGNDFSGGVYIDNLRRLENLQTPPEGVQVMNLVVDTDGNVYCQD